MDSEVNRCIISVVFLTKLHLTIQSEIERQIQYLSLSVNQLDNVQCPVLFLQVNTCATNLVIGQCADLYESMRLEEKNSSSVFFASSLLFSYKSVH